MATIHNVDGTITISRPGWPKLNIDGPERITKLQAARERAEANLPEVFRIEYRGRLYRVRGWLDDDGACGVCEWWWNGQWRRMVNQEIARTIKAMAPKTP